MNRKRFLRLLGIGSVAAVIAPKMLAEQKPKGILLAPDSMSDAERNAFAQEWRKFNGQIIYRDHSPTLYVGENTYKQIERLAVDYMGDNAKGFDAGYCTINHFNGWRIIKHPLLKPNACFKVTGKSWYNSAEWMNNIAKPYES